MTTVLWRNDWVLVNYQGDVGTDEKKGLHRRSEVVPTRVGEDVNIPRKDEYEFDVGDGSFGK